MRLSGSDHYPRFAELQVNRGHSIITIVHVAPLRTLLSQISKLRTHFTICNGVSIHEYKLTNLEFCQ